jgi:hypothetical protein
LSGVVLVVIHLPVERAGGSSGSGGEG